MSYGKEHDYKVKLEAALATITELENALKGIAARKDCVHDVNGCIAAQTARAALKESDDE